MTKLSKIGFIVHTHLFLKFIFKATQLQKNTGIGYLLKNTILHFSVKYQFGTKRYSSCRSTVFIKRFYFCQQKTDHFWSFNAFLKKYKLKEKFWDNLQENICRLFNFLAKFLFTRSETERKFYHQKVIAGIPSLVAERLRLRILGN